MKKLKKLVSLILGLSMMFTVLPKASAEVEIWTFDDKSTFFEEVFGIEPILERVNK